MASCFLDCQPRQSNRCGALLCRGNYEIGRQQLPRVCRLWFYHGINFTKPWRRKHRSHAQFSVRVKSVFERYYKVFRVGTPFLKSDSDPGTQFLRHFIGFRAQCSSWFGGIDIGWSESVLFIFNRKNELFPIQHKVSVPSYFRFTSQSY